MQTEPLTFIFDLHDVLVKKHYGALAKRIVKQLYRFDLITLLLNRSFLKTMIRLLRTSRVPEHYMMTLAACDKRLNPFIDEIITWMNEQIPIVETIDMVKRLKHHGHTLYLFSNIGEKTFNQFRKKFPDLIALFDNYIIAEASDGWIQKPQLKSFEKLFATFHLDPTTAIFIDNNKKNIITAQQFGLMTIHYTSPRQLYTELQQFGVIN